MRVLVSGGGTGGHVYPALAVVEVLQNVEPTGLAARAPTAVALLWVGSQGGMEEELVSRSGIQFIGLPAGGVRGKGLGESLQNGFRIAKSVHTAYGLLARFRPAVVLVTGGYACVAVTIAAWVQHVPVLIYLPDIEPGMAIRFLSQLASRVAVTSEESIKYLPRHKSVVTGYPVRAELFRSDRAQARQALGLDPDEKMLLVFGGSRGAQSINQALIAGLPSLLEICQIVHLSGQLDAERVRETTRDLPERLKSRYHRYAYLHNMPQALAAADLAVARAGAATMGELPAVGLPAVLVPYPYSGQHQAANAHHLAQNGAARIVSDAQLTAQLVPTVLALLADDDALASMSKAAKALARPEAAQAIAQQLRVLARTGAGGQVGATR